MPNPPTSQYTGTFFELLSKAKLSLVVSTYQAQKLVILRAQDKEINTHFVDLKKPMGVAFQNKQLSVGSGNRVVSYHTSRNAAAKLENGGLYDGVFVPRSAHITGDIDIHEMAFDAADKLWLINTRMSCLCTLDYVHSFKPEWRPPFISGYDTTDRCHLNGLAMRDGRPKYVTALGDTDTAAGWRDKKADGGIAMDIESNQIIAQNLSMPHSPRWYRGKLWVLESGAGQLITINPNTGGKTIVAQVPGFCRGIDFVDRFAIIGLSKIRETAVFAGLPLTEREQERHCGIWIVDIETGQTAGYLNFLDGVDEIFSVQAVPFTYPELLDFNHPMLDSTYSVPESVIEEFTTATSQQIAIDQAREHHHKKVYDKAIALYKQVLLDEPDNAQINFSIGDALISSARWNDASAYIEKAIRLNDNNAEAHLAKGKIELNQGAHEQALGCFNKAIAIDQQFAAAHFHRGCLYLIQEDFDKGWSGFEWRLKIPGYRTFQLPHPIWDGKDISDKNLLIVAEQSIGDSVFFSRFLPMLRDRCKRLIVACDKGLQPLLTQIDCIDEVRLHGKLSTDSFDVYCPLNSLAFKLQINSLSEIPDSNYPLAAAQLGAPMIELIQQSESLKWDEVFSEQAR